MKVTQSGIANKANKVSSTDICIGLLINRLCRIHPKDNNGRFLDLNDSSLGEVRVRLHQIVLKLEGICMPNLSELLRELQTIETKNNSLESEASRHMIHALHEIHSLDSFLNIIHKEWVQLLEEPNSFCDQWSSDGEEPKFEDMASQEDLVSPSWSQETMKPFASMEHVISSLPIAIETKAEMPEAKPFLRFCGDSQAGRFIRYLLVVCSQMSMEAMNRLYAALIEFVQSEIQETYDTGKEDTPSVDYANSMRAGNYTQAERDLHSFFDHKFLAISNSILSRQPELRGAFHYASKDLAKLCSLSGADSRQFRTALRESMTVARQNNDLKMQSDLSEWQAASGTPLERKSLIQQELLSADFEAIQKTMKSSGAEGPSHLPASVVERLSALSSSCLLSAVIEELQSGAPAVEPEIFIAWENEIADDVWSSVYRGARKPWQPAMTKSNVRFSSSRMGRIQIMLDIIIDRCLAGNGHLPETRSNASGSADILNPRDHRTDTTLCSAYLLSSSAWLHFGNIDMALAFIEKSEARCRAILANGMKRSNPGTVSLYVRSICSRLITKAEYRGQIVESMGELETFIRPELRSTFDPKLVWILDELGLEQEHVLRFTFLELEFWDMMNRGRYEKARCKCIEMLSFQSRPSDFNTGSVSSNYRMEACSCEIELEIAIGNLSAACFLAYQMLDEAMVCNLARYGLKALVYLAKAHFAADSPFSALSYCLMACSVSLELEFIEIYLPSMLLLVELLHAIYDANKALPVLRSILPWILQHGTWADQAQCRLLKFRLGQASPTIDDPKAGFRDVIKAKSMFEKIGRLSDAVLCDDFLKAAK